MPNAPAPSILIVDDHVDTVRALSRLLEMAGYSVLAAYDAETAFQLALSRKIDLMICDVGLPVCNGWDLFQRILKERPIRGIALSGYCAASDAQHSLAAGFSAHLNKPIAIADLESAVSTALERPQPPPRHSGLSSA